MKIGVLFDGPAALGKGADLAILDTVEAVEKSLVPDGNTVVRVPCNPDGRWVERVRRGKFDLIFNLCEGMDGVAELEPSVISAVEVIGLPYTGSSSWTTAMCLRKHVVNSILDRAGLPIPRFAVVHPGDADAARRLSRDREARRRGRVDRRRAALRRPQHPPARRARRRDARALGRGARPEVRRRPRGERRHPRRHGAAGRRDQVRRHAARHVAHRLVQEQVGDRLRRGPRLRAAVPRRAARRS